MFLLKLKKINQSNCDQETETQANDIVWALFKLSCSESALRFFEAAVTQKPSQPCSMFPLLHLFMPIIFQIDILLREFLL